MSKYGERQALVDALCILISKSLPDAEMGMKWNAPNFAVDGRDFVTLNLPPKGGVRVVLHRGAKAVDTRTGSRLLDDQTGRLTWATDQRAYIAFGDVADVEKVGDWLADLLARWVSVARID